MNNSFSIDSLLRENIRKLTPYSSARDEFTGEAAIFLDANENPFNAPYNRYPDPLQTALKEKIARLKGINSNQLFLGNGSDEAIDLLFRAFCRPGVDNIVSISPTYGMYQVAADINDIEVRKVMLNSDFSLSPEKILEAVDETTKLIFLCSPNNPTGNVLEKASMEQVFAGFNGLVVIDEAYIDFCPEESMVDSMSKYPNLVILQTFSKAWGMAGIRLGMAIADPQIIEILNRIKYPYNLNILTQEKAMELIDKTQQQSQWVNIIIQERDRMVNKLEEFPFVEKIFPTDANFVLVRMHDARGIYNYLVDEGIIVRDRSRIELCEESLRITIGSPEENNTLLDKLHELIT